MYKVSNSITANVAVIYFYKLHFIPYEGENFSALLLPQANLNSFHQPGIVQLVYRLFQV